MPSVGMRHSTKAFLPKPVGKDGESVTVLFRSGEIAYYKSNGWRKVIPEQDIDALDDMDIEGDPDVVGSEVEINEVGEGNVDDAQSLEERKFKNVYDRKRRRRTKDDRLYGMFYTRKRFRKTGPTSSGVGNSDDGGASVSSVSHVESLGQASYSDRVPLAILDVLIDSSPVSSFRTTEFFVSVLKFVRDSHVTLRELAAFVCCKPIVGVFSGHGIHFKPGIFPGDLIANDISPRGFCRIFGDQTSIPLFWLNCRVAPLTFINLHATLILRSLYHPYHHKFFWAALSELVNLFLEGKNVPSILPPEICYNPTDRTISIDSAVRKNSSNFSGQGFELDWKRISTRNAVYQSFQKKRSSLRSKRPISSLSEGLYGLQHFDANNKLNIKNPAKKNRGALGSEMFRTINDRCPPSATLKSNMKQTNLGKKNISQNGRKVKSTLVGLRRNIDSTYCCANALVIESDKCYREEGVIIMSEFSTSKGWHLVVKAHGSTKFIYQALTEIKPCSTNRFTHALMWTSENDWKLEFYDKEDWLVFKKLYKECADRNIKYNSARANPAAAIPVPGVREVLNYDDGEHARFFRPDSYITATGNEVTRALAKMTTIYEMSQDDEEWLEKLNSGLANGDGDAAEYLSAEKFEEIIDVFEKSAYSSLGDISDESKFTSLLSYMGRDDIVVAVYKYWHEKRKHKGAPLLKVFECQPPKRPPVEKETVSRKKRSVKRNPSQNGRGRPRSVRQGMSADQNELHWESDEESLSDLEKKIKEAVSHAERTAAAATAKRKKAQQLATIADKAACLAVMAFKIAESAQLAEPANAPDELLPKPSE